MTATASIDKFGRVLIPKRVRDELHLDEGTKMRIRTEGESLVLEPEDEVTGELVRVDGVLVWRSYSGQVVTQDMVNEVLEAGRNERHARAGG